MKIHKVSGKIEQKRIGELVGRKELFDRRIADKVRLVIEDVRKSGDKALIDYTEKFDCVSLDPASIRVSDKEIDDAYGKVDAGVVDAIRKAAKHIKSFYERIYIQPGCLKDLNGAIAEDRIRPLKSVGIYVPGGRFPYPSTVLMNAIPAKAAGVKEIVMCSPPRTDGGIDPAVLIAASEVGVDKVFKAGGAQAIAAMAYGTETVTKVDKITGPGNIYVTMAKREVFGIVGIDMLAGPSEVLIIADETAPPEFIAQDMKAQAEHDPDALAVLVTTSQALAEKTGSMADGKNMMAFVVGSLDDAVRIANILAPEHLEIMTKDNDRLAGEITEAGAIFIGQYTPTAIGDYYAGPNHTLPTGGTARFSSPLSVYDFVKRTSVIRYTADALNDVSGTVSKLAEIEGLVEHLKSIKIRVDKG